jgi:hypothetical protein
VFFAILREHDVVFRVELEGSSRTLDTGAIAAANEQLGVPVRAEAAHRGDLLDPTALLRTPKVYKPTQIADWRGPGRKPASIMEALLEWPRMDAAAGLAVLGRVIRTGRRRRALLKR